MNNTMIRYLSILVICAGLLLSCVSSPSSPPTSSSGGSSSGGTTATPQTQAERDRRQNIYMQYLRSEGYVPSLDKDNDILFKLDGYNFYIIIGKNDPSFLILLKPNIWSIDSESERVQAANAVAYANRATKVAKAYISGSTNQWVSLSAELYVDDPNQFGLLFKRLIRMINKAGSEFEGQMRN